MVKKKADNANKPRVVKTWRIKGETIRLIEKMAKDGKKAECEIIETAIYVLHQVSKV